MELTSNQKAALIIVIMLIAGGYLGHKYLYKPKAAKWTDAEIRRQDLESVLDSLKADFRDQTPERRITELGEELKPWQAAYEVRKDWYLKPFEIEENDPRFQHIWWNKEMDKISNELQEKAARKGKAFEIPRPLVTGQPGGDKYMFNMVLHSITHLQTLWGILIESSVTDLGGGGLQSAGIVGRQQGSQAVKNYKYSLSFQGSWEQIGDLFSRILEAEGHLELSDPKLSRVEGTGTEENPETRFNVSVSVIVGALI
ncbi:hypothetical protein ACFL1X_06295 [Candidatus Hydrogenedentota bacterium]